jgi:predicted DNA binding CopG/RHH family protein
MKQPKLNDLVIDRKGTQRMRTEAAKTKKVKITINIDQDSLEALREMAGKSGASYQKLLNQILKEGLKKRDDAEARLDRLEKELEQLKRKRVA